MAKHVPFGKFKGDWYNRGRGRVANCPKCGHQFTVFIRLKSAVCPRGHNMKLLTNSNPNVVRNLRARGSVTCGENRYSEAAEKANGVQLAPQPNPTLQKAPQTNKQLTYEGAKP